MKPNTWYISVALATPATPLTYSLLMKVSFKFEAVFPLLSYSYVSIKNSYQIIVLLKGFSKINKNSVLNKSSESENELLI